MKLLRMGLFEGACIFTAVDDWTPLPDECLAALELAGVPVKERFDGTRGYGYAFSGTEARAKAIQILCDVYGYTIK